MRVLLVEDDELLADAIQRGLQRAGHTVDHVSDGIIASAALRDATLDLAVLDLGLPRLDGLGVLRELRAGGSSLPVLVLTARDTLPDRITGLDTGADDYLVKPFEMDELCARLRAIGRRRSGRAVSVLRYGDLVLDQTAREVTRAGEKVMLGASEIAILEILLENCGHALSKERLGLALYGWDDGVESNTIEVHIHHLRKKLGKTLIHTLRGIGYLIPQQPR